METWLSKLEWLSWLSTSEFWQHPAVIFALTLISFWMLRRLFGRLRKKTLKTANKFDDIIVHALEKPAKAMIWVVGLALIVDAVGQESDWIGFTYRNQVFSVAVVLLLAWFALRLITKRESQYLNHEVHTRLDETTVSALAKLSRLIVVALASLMIMQSLGLSISAVVAFGGIGGAAIAFSAKDLLANLFGGVMIHLDRPFKVGDWIYSPEKEIEGTVEYIGWRLTRIRRFDRRPLYAPNSLFTQVVIINASRMTNRRIYETIGIRYGDFDKMASVVKEVKTYLENHPELDTTRTLIVNFNQYNSSSLDFFIYTFTKTTEWVRYHEIKQEVLLKVGEIIQSHSAEIAFPTRTLHVENASAVEQSVELSAATAVR
jgi:MscS family membrane protein